MTIEAFVSAWGQLESLRRITEMTGDIHELQLKQLKNWPRLAVSQCVKSVCTWKPTPVLERDNPTQIIAPDVVKSVDEVRCNHTTDEGVRLYKTICIRCNPSLAWPGHLTDTVTGVLTVDITTNPRKKEPKGLSLRLMALGKSIQALLGKGVRVVVNIDGTQTFVKEPWIS